MNTTKNLLIAAAMTGALAAIPLSARAAQLTPMSGPSADKLGCQGMAGQSGDKHSCKGKNQQAKKHDKSSCAGKHGCSGKDKQN